MIELGYFTLMVANELQMWSLTMPVNARADREREREGGREREKGTESRRESENREGGGSERRGLV